MLVGVERGEVGSVEAESEEVEREEEMVGEVEGSKYIVYLGYPLYNPQNQTHRTPCR